MKVVDKGVISYILKFQATWIKNEEVVAFSVEYNLLKKVPLGHNLSLIHI